MTPRTHEQGMALVTVLMLIAIAAAALAIMMASEDAGLQRARRMGDAARARAIAEAGELSAIAALRRDHNSDSDDATEQWANIADRGSPIPGGRFQIVVTDAQGKLDLNPLFRGDALTQQRLTAIATAMRLPRGAGDRIAARLATGGPIVDLAELGETGLAPADITRLATVATALPLPSTINLNAAPESLLALLIANPVAAHALATRRAGTGRIGAGDLANERVNRPAGSGFTSRLFWVSSRATIGDTSQQLTSLLLRRPAADGRFDVVAIARWRGATGPAQAPVLKD
jgi:general secretion pathway protein K